MTNHVNHFSMGFNPIQQVEPQEVAQTDWAVGVAAPNAEDLPQRLVLHFLADAIETTGDQKGHILLVLFNGNSRIQLMEVR